ncbi:hypothetical protein VTO73DRAFT_2280 [Trametes versicolor]
MYMQPPPHGPAAEQSRDELECERPRTPCRRNPPSQVSLSRFVSRRGPRLSCSLNTLLRIRACNLERARSPYICPSMRYIRPRGIMTLPRAPRTPARPTLLFTATPRPTLACARGRSLLYAPMHPWTCVYLRPSVAGPAYVPCLSVSVSARALPDRGHLSPPSLFL